MVMALACALKPAAASPAVTADYEWWPGVSPNDYADTAALLADSGDFSTGEDENAAQITLDTGLGLSPSTKSMLYTWPQDIAAEYTVGRNLTLPSTQTELWAEFAIRFSSNFSTLGPGGGTPDYKLIFARVDAGTRFGFNIGQGGSGNNYQLTHPGTGGGGYWTGTDSTELIDAANHTFRIHCKIGAGTGRQRFWVDGTLKHDEQNLNTDPATNMYGLALGRNTNKGTGSWTQTLHWLRVRVWYAGNDPGW